MDADERLLSEIDHIPVSEKRDRRSCSRRVAVLGLGASTVTANNLASGVDIPPIDRDYVDATNLQRQVPSTRGTRRKSFQRPRRPAGTFADKFRDRADP